MFFEQLITLTRQYEEYMNYSSPQEQLRMLISLFKSGQSMVNDLEGIFDCYNLTNFFRPVDTEEDIIKFATEQEKTGSFLSS